MDRCDTWNVEIILIIRRICVIKKIYVVKKTGICYTTILKKKEPDIRERR